MQSVAMFTVKDINFNLHIRLQSKHKRSIYKIKYIKYKKKKILRSVKYLYTSKTE